MKTVFEHIEHVRGKPHHIRKQIAFSVAGAVTGLIALVWLAGSVGAGVFALKDTSFAQSTGGEEVRAVSGDPAGQLAGVTSAVLPSLSEPSRIQIIDATSSAMLEKETEQTTIPF